MRTTHLATADEPRDGATSPRLISLFASVVIPVFVASLLLADRSLPYDIDPFTNVITAHSLATTGSPILADQRALAEDGTWARYAWVVDSERGPVSQYPPGAALFAAPFYLLDTDSESAIVTSTNEGGEAPIEVIVPEFWPAALAGSLAVALAAGFTALSVATLTKSTRWGLGAGILLVTGTGVWLNGGYQLWQHGVSSMWIALAVWLSLDHRWLGSGLAMGLAVLTRPPVAIVSAALGIGASLRARSVRPALVHGLGAGAGLSALLTYNYWLFGSLTITGGYSLGDIGGPTYTERLVVQDNWYYVENLVGGLFSPGRGLLLWSPFVLAAAWGSRRVWRQVPGAVAWAAVGGLILLLVQLRINRYSGGAGFHSYRYPIETVTAAFTFLAAGAHALSQRSFGLRALAVSAGAAVGVHALAIVDELSR